MIVLFLFFFEGKFWLFTYNNNYYFFLHEIFFNWNRTEKIEIKVFEPETTMRLQLRFWFLTIENIRFRFYSKLIPNLLYPSLICCAKIIKFTSKSININIKFLMILVYRTKYKIDWMARVHVTFQSEMQKINL